MQGVFQLTAPAPLDPVTLVVNLGIDAVLAASLGWHFVRFGRTLANRKASARTLLFVSLTTVLIISVVKSSLALSLGLVGALSIVRFRTPIKDPEELAYLFLAIALGLGLGADQRLATILAFLVILGILTFRRFLAAGKKAHHLFLNVEVPQTDGSGVEFSTVTGLLTDHVSVADLRRLDVREGAMQVSFYIDCEDDRALVAAMDSLKKGLPGASISFVDQEQIIAV
jgi:hypothetical protein